MKGDELFLGHILDAMEAVNDYTANVPRVQFLQNRMMQDAVVRQLEIIGEAARNLSDEARAQHPDVEWNQIISLRNRLTHAYFQVDIELVWEIVTTDLPLLKRELAAG